MRKIALLGLLVAVNSIQAKAEVKPNLDCVATASETAVSMEKRENPGEQIELRLVRYLDESADQTPGAGRYAVYLERQRSGPILWLALLDFNCQVLDMAPDRNLVRTRDDYGRGECRRPHPPGCCTPDHLCK